MLELVSIIWFTAAKMARLDGLNQDPHPKTRPPSG
jgi:hypothetical protein